jgi:heme exporter protein D
MSDTGRTTYDQATREYDPDFERAVANAVIEAIAQVSRVTDANVMVLRVGEIIAALVTVLATTIALSPAVTRSPTQKRKFLDETAKRLRRQAMQAADDPATKWFRDRCFTSGDGGGHA